MNEILTELDDDDRIRIRDIFNNEINPKLQRAGARMGSLNCEFAGERYKNWNIIFRSVGSDFEISDFEYDEKGSGIDLDL
ncbi:MAG: hypothetical protein JW882_15075 [Deltaproteobacteria bacterium]|nr:hypothetical protein [Deltaproteobacteria bacterium]